MTVELFKKKVKYTNDKNEEKIATNFYIQCGDVLIPVEVKYFPDSETGKDARYGERKQLVSAFAQELPEKPKN